MPTPVRSRRCPPCNIDWPNLDDCRTCPVCRADTFNNDAAPDFTITQAREAIRTHARPYSSQLPTADLPAVNPVYAHRLERYTALGFSEADSHLLASTKDDLGVYLYHGYIAARMAEGATHAQVLAVFA